MLRLAKAAMTGVALLSAFSLSAGDDVKVFGAANFSPILRGCKEAAEKALGSKLVMEFSGSQVACRKISELGRDCDLLILADNALFKKLVAKECKWRLDFACDSMVLGVGSRARRSDDAERDWRGVILDPAVSWGRVDENLAPVGYRTLLLLKLADPSGALLEKLLAKADRKCDDVSAMAALLRNGDLDYGFLYRSASLNYDIRFVELPAEIDMGSEKADYSKASVSFRNTAGKEIKVSGSPICYALSIPAKSANAEGALKFVRFLLADSSKRMESSGLRLFKPKFYGTKEDFEPLKDFAVHAGAFD